MESPESAPLTPAHHRAVAHLPPANREEWLEAARESGWSANLLRRVLRETSMLTESDREKLLAGVREARADLSEADRLWRERIRAAAPFFPRREVGDAAGISHTEVRRILDQPVEPS